MSTKIFVLSSANEAKRVAAESVLRELYGDAFELRTVEVNSGVSETPITDDEGIQGCLERIAGAKQAVPDADGYVGLEGIITTNRYGTFLCGWAVIALADGRIGYGCSAKIRLPDELLENFDSFKKLASLTAEKYPGRAGDLPSIGTNGVLTGGMYTRVDEFRDALRCALGTITN
jgi:non-canonical (house-cleaning) NTP pyrophosphatase